MRTLYYLFGGLPRDALRMAAWFLLLAVVFVPLERVCGLHRQKILRRGIYGDVGFYFVSSLVPKVLLILPLSLIVWMLHRVEPFAFYAWAADLPFWQRQSMALVVGEVGLYWGHRWSHSVPLLWRFHAVHHAAEEMDWLVHTRVHPVDSVFTRLCGLVPLYVVGLAQPSGVGLDAVPLVVIFLTTAWGFFIHSNVKWRLGWFEQLVASPGFHHWHHTNSHGNGTSPDVINKNFAPNLPWIDRCFGTLYLPKSEWPESYGLAAESISEAPARDLANEVHQQVSAV